MLLRKALGTEGTATAKDQSRSGEGGFDTQSGCGRISVRAAAQKYQTRKGLGGAELSD